MHNTPSRPDHPPVPSEAEARAALHKDDDRFPDEIIDPEVEEEVVKWMTDPDSWNQFWDIASGKTKVAWPEGEEPDEAFWQRLRDLEKQGGAQ